MAELASEHEKIVKEILAREVPGCEVRIFGSRSQGKSQENSDLDLILIGKEKLDWKHIERVKEAFSGSDLPFNGGRG